MELVPLSALRAMHFNDQYFAQAVYQDRRNSSSPDLVSVVRDQIPSDPTTHADGEVGISSRWWYLPGMFKPVFQCGSCTLQALPPGEDGGAVFSVQFRGVKQRYDAAATGDGQVDRAVCPSVELYKVPSMDLDSKSRLAKECASGPGMSRVSSACMHAPARVCWK